MNDEAYCFVQDNKARKQMAYGAKKKVRGGGKTVIMPSDNLTAKQRKELNSKVATYAMDKPHTYYELLAFPKDIRKEYLQGLVDKYHPSIHDLTTMMHVKRQTVEELLKSLGVETPRYYRNPTEKFEWRVFMGETAKQPAPEPDPVNPEAAPVAPLPIYSGIGSIDHLSIHVVGKPLQVANGIPVLLDANKQYYFSINITEVKEECSMEDSRELDPDP